MNDTPRTDKFEIDYFNEDTSHVDDVFEYARKLERENATLEQKLHALRLICGTTDANKFQTRLDLILEENIALQADKERLDAVIEECRHRLGMGWWHATMCDIYRKPHKDGRYLIDIARKEIK